MAHPKRKISKQRRDKRRTHQKLKTPTIAICPETQVAHLRHRAYKADDGSWYYKGKMIIAPDE